MKRRNITISGEPVSVSTQRFRKAKEVLRQQLLTDNETLDRLIRYLLNSGWDAQDVESFQKQASAETPFLSPILAFLHHNEHVIDQLILSQGSYTEFTDTASDPNYALRHKGQVETVLRRIKPGDLLMMQAAQMLSAVRGPDDSPSENTHDYWQRLWASFSMLIVPERDRNDLRWLWEDLNAAALSSLMFLNDVLKEHYDYHSAYAYNKFMAPESRFYTGFAASSDVRRVEGDRFKMVHLIEHVADRDESRAMAAIAMACDGIDKKAEALFDSGKRLQIGEPLHYPFLKHLRKLQEPPAYVYHTVQ